MAFSMVKVTIVGRLGKDGESQFTPNGKAVTKFSIALDKGMGENKRTLWFNITAWGESFIKMPLLKGRMVTITNADFDVRTYDKKDGSSGTSYDLTVNSPFDLIVHDAAAPREQQPSGDGVADRPRNVRAVASVRASDDW